MTNYKQTLSSLKSPEDQIRESVRRMDVPPAHVFRRLFVEEKLSVEREKRDTERRMQQIKMNCDAAMTRIILSASDHSSNLRAPLLERIRNGEI
jgi:hypothetical protein